MTSLIERYIAATNDGFPSGDQAEVEREVRVALNDIVEARMDQGMSQEDAEKAAVEELGNPVTFASQFRRNPRYLIGPDLFGSWWFILRMLLVVVTPIIMVATGIGTSADSDAGFAEVIGETIGSGFNFAIQASFWVTLVYFVIGRIGITPEMEGSLVPKSTWSIDDLPELETGRQIGKWDVILQMVPLSLLVWFVSQLARDGMGAFGLHNLLDGISEDQAVFHPDVSPVWFWALIALVVMNVLVAAWSFMVGYWNSKVTIVNVLAALAWIAFIVALAQRGDILNPQLRGTEAGKGEWSIAGDNSNNIIVGIFVIVSLIEIWDSISGHLKFRQQPRVF